MSQAHRTGIIHRDLKPSNIMIDRDGNVRIMDFGIARSLKEKGVTGTGIMIGTPEYISPEQVDAQEVDRRSDIYSLGVVLYEMLTGELPFKGETPLSVAIKQKTERPKDPQKVNANIPAELGQLVLRCLEKNKEKRYQHVEDLLSIIAKLIESKQVKEKTTTWENSIAVLPFENLSADPEQEYFCDGITEELINSFTQIKDLRVIARTSSFMFKGKHEDIRDIGAKLNVKFLLEGSVRKSGNRLRITAQLVDVSDGSHLWSERFDREMEDIFTIQDEISLAIVDKLKVKLLRTEKADLLKRATEDIDAFNYYLKGRYFCRTQRTKTGLNKSLEFYQKAIKKDPEFALAYTGSSITYMYLGWMNYIPPRVAYKKAKAHALNALEIDDSIGEAHSAMAWVLDLFDWNWAGAKREFERAIAINASDAETHHKYSHLLAEMGHFDESIEAMDRAIALEPIAIDIHACAGMNLYFARRYEDAIEQLNKTIELDPNFYDPYGWLGITYTQLGQYRQAIEIFQKAEAFPEISTRMVATQAYTYALAGQKNEAKKRLEQLVKLFKNEPVEPYFIAWVYVGLGQKDRAIDYLDKAFEARSGFMRMFIKIDPWLDSLHKESRFIELLKKTGLS